MRTRQKTAEVGTGGSVSGVVLGEMPRVDVDAGGTAKDYAHCRWKVRYCRIITSGLTRR
jgi:hypothetical protein